MKVISEISLRDFKFWSGGEGGLHSLEGIKELEYYFRDYDIRVW